MSPENAYDPCSCAILVAAGARRRFVVALVRRLWKFIAIFVSINVVAAVGFYLLQRGISPLDAFYWSIVTISTTGYGDIVPTLPAARVFAMGVLYTQIFLIGYLFSVIAGIVTDESQRRLLGTLGTSMKEHIVVLGYSAVGRAAVRELLLEEQRIAVVAERAEDVANIHALAPESSLYVTYGAPAELDILKRANVPGSRSVIVCTADDTTNLIASLNVRSLAPHARIVVSVNRPELKDTLRAAGVTYVASPSDMGGRLCADAAFRPEVANAVEDLTSASYGVDIHEYVLRPGMPLSGLTFGEMDRAIRDRTGCILFGYARKVEADYKTFINPAATEQLQPSDAVLVLGSLEQLKRCQTLFGVPDGR